MARKTLSSRLMLQPLEDRWQPSTVRVPTVAVPTANDDFADTDGNNPVAVAVLANDAAANGLTLNPATVHVLSGPFHGRVSFDTKSGDVTYTSIGFFQGTDTFYYNVKDSSGAVSTTAKVSVVINRPVANDDFAQTTGINPVVIPVLDNDTDPDGNAEIDPSSVKIIDQSHGGSLSINSITGEITYFATKLTSESQNTFSGTYTFTYTIADKAGAESAPGTVTVVVMPVPGTVVKPVAVDDATDTDAGNPVLVNVTVNDVAAAGTTININSVQIVTAPTHGQAFFGSPPFNNGNVQYSPAAGFRGTDSFTYSVRDSNGLISNVATVTIVVNRPTANDDFADTDGNNPVTIDVLANDTDPDGNGELDAASVKVTTNPEHGAVSIDTTTGAITYTGTGLFQGTDTFQYTVTDKAGAESNAATVTIVINRPTANADAATTTGTTPVTIDVLANDTDPEGYAEIDVTSVKIIDAPQHGSASVDPRTGQVTYTPDGHYLGTDAFSYSITDLAGAESYPATIRIRIAATNNKGRITEGADAGGGPRVNVYGYDGTLLSSFFAYDPKFTGGVRVATGDVTGDGVPDIVTAPGAGGGPHVKVFDGVTGQLLNSFFAYDAKFSGGVTIAVGDVNGDGRADIITGAGAGGGPHVKVFNGLGHDGQMYPGPVITDVLFSFFALFPSFTGGVNVAAGDVDGDGHADIVTGAAGPLHLESITFPANSPFAFYGSVNVFSGVDASRMKSYSPFDTNLAGGVSVAAADFNADGRADIVVSAGAGGGPHVKVIDSQTGVALASFFAYDPKFTGGTRTAAGDVNGDGRPDLIVSSGSGTSLPTRIYDGSSFDLLREDSPFGSFRGGVFVGAPG
ncbi:hypothetical protein BH11PLA2_BH11PLA2_29310 [soil metagenome]